MSDSSRFESLSVKTAADIESWHPDLAMLVRYDLPFVCFDREGSAVHISREATMLLARHRHLDAVFWSIRKAAADQLAAFHAQAEGATPGTPDAPDAGGTPGAPATPATPAAATSAPRGGVRVSDPGDGASWSIHVVRTRHDWPIAIAVCDGARTSHSESPLRERLTRRELEVASLVAEGAPAKNVAAALSITVHTARRHTEQVFRKLGVHSRAELTRVVLRGGEVRMSGPAYTTELRLSGAA